MCLFENWVVGPPPQNIKNNNYRGDLIYIPSEVQFSEQVSCGYCKENEPVCRTWKEDYNTANSVAHPVSHRNVMAWSP